MTFLLRYIATQEGETIHDETVVADLGAISALEKDVWVLGQCVTLRIEFDPALSPVLESASLRDGPNVP